MHRRVLHILRDNYETRMQLQAMTLNVLEQEASARGAAVRCAALTPLAPCGAPHQTLEQEEEEARERAMQDAASTMTGTTGTELEDKAKQYMSGQLAADSDSD